MPVMQTILGRLARRRDRIKDAAGLSDFVSTRAAFVAQKCITEFCRVRTGVYWEKLFREEQFQQALMRSNWMAFTPALAMLAEMVEGILRSKAASAEVELRGALVQLAQELRARMMLPAPVERSEWDAQSGLVSERLEQAALAPPRPVRELADPLARNVFDVLPLHVSLLTNDYDYIFNNLRMNILAAHTAFGDNADTDSITRDLLPQDSSSSGLSGTSLVGMR